MSISRNTKKRAADNTEDSVEKRSKEEIQQDPVAPTINSSDNMDVSQASSSSITLVTDPKTEAKSDLIPEKWRWVRDLIDEAHLPNLGLPVKWDKTSKNDIMQAFDPTTGRIIDIRSGEVSKPKSSPVGFIMSTKDKNPIPGTQAPAAVRFSRYMQPCINDHLVKDTRGNTLAPCIAHGDYVSRIFTERPCSSKSRYICQTSSFSQRA